MEKEREDTTMTNTFSPYFTGALALFYIGMTLGCACKYAKVKKLERGE